MLQFGMHRIPVLVCLDTGYPANLKAGYSDNLKAGFPANLKAGYGYPSGYQADNIQYTLKYLPNTGYRMTTAKNTRLKVRTGMFPFPILNL
jgi:hypothetical protein